MDSGTRVYGIQLVRVLSSRIESPGSMEINGSGLKLRPYVMGLWFCI